MGSRLVPATSYHGGTRHSLLLSLLVDPSLRTETMEVSPKGSECELFPECVRKRIRTLGTCSSAPLKRTFRSREQVQQITPMACWSRFLANAVDIFATTSRETLALSDSVILFAFHPRPHCMGTSAILDRFAVQRNEHRQLGHPRAGCWQMVEADAIPRVRPERPRHTAPASRATVRH